jgi:hypothetical protein
VDLLVSLPGGVLVDRSIAVGDIDSPLDGWLRRLAVPLDFTALGGGVEPPLGELANLQFSLTANGSSTEMISASLTLVAGLPNPE